MNIKLKDNTIYYKISNSELNSLTNGNKLSTKLCFNKQELEFNLSLQNKQEITSVNNQNILTVNCFITKNNALTLQEMGRNKQGLEINFNKVTAFIQLDLKTIGSNK